MPDQLVRKVVGFRLWYYGALSFGGLAAILILISVRQFNDYGALSVTVCLFTFILNENNILRSYLGKQEWSKWLQFQARETLGKSTT